MRNYNEFDTGKIPEKPSSGESDLPHNLSNQTMSRDLDSYTHITPDDIYGDNSCTFIYNPQSEKVYLSKYPATHNVMLKADDYKIAKELGLKPKFLGRTWQPSRNDLMRANIPNGRIGKFEDINAIGFWTDVELDRSQVDEIVNKVLEIRTDISKEKIVIFSNYSYGFLPFIINQSANNTSKQEEDPCVAYDSIEINGELLSLKSILRDLHMVKGNKLEKIKTGFCQKYSSLKRNLENSKCTNQLMILNQIKEFIDCSYGPKDYENLKQGGRANYRQDLKSLFQRNYNAAIDPNSTEDPLGTEFRGRQSDIDAAFDYLNHRESFSGFKNWLIKEAKNEEECRKSSGINTTSHKRNRW